MDKKDSYFERVGFSQNIPRPIKGDVFLKLWFSQIAEITEKDMWIQFFCLKNNQDIEIKYTNLDKPENTIQSILKLNEKGYNIFYSVCPLNRKERQERNVKYVPGAWIDIDLKHQPENTDIEDLLNRLREFSYTPSIIIRSGHGIHSYWKVKEPLEIETEKDRIEHKKLLAGLIKVFNGDQQPKGLQSLMRLPGTKNYKNSQNPVECDFIELNLEAEYVPEQGLDNFKDETFIELETEKHIDLDFEGGTYQVNHKNPSGAQKDIEKLSIGKTVKRMIIAGECKKGNKTYRSRSERDLAIIIELLGNNYDYQTIENIFFNRFLGCSDRILEAGKRKKEKLKYDVQKGLRLLSREKEYLKPREKTINQIKDAPGGKDEQIKLVSRYISRELLESMGKGYFNKQQVAYFFFNEQNKLLYNVENEDFSCFLKNTYGLLEKELPEVIATIKSDVLVKGEEIEPHNFAFFNDSKHTLYITDHNNQIYKLSGKEITKIDNGADNIIFKFNPVYSSYSVDLKNDKLVNYFKGGFSWENFKDSLVYRYIIDLANLSIEEKHKLTPEEQKYILTIWIYSLFFESIIQDKPILCFLGVKASGKSFLATLIGKILFGRNFLASPLPENRKDFQVNLSRNYYIVFDNLDSRIPGKFLDDLCLIATSGMLSHRKLYTDNEEVLLRPRVFVSMTSRTPKFKRDDFVDRLLLLNTEKVKKPRSRSSLNTSVLNIRNKLWAELMVNLNEIVQLLKDKKDWNPAGIFRMADWELFGKKIHSDNTRNHFISLLEKMNKEKNKFSLEDDYLYQYLYSLIYEQGQKIEGRIMADIHQDLLDWGERKKIRGIERKYSSPRSLGNRLANIKDELSDEFEIEVIKNRQGVNQYYIETKDNLGGSSE